jgi:hypothetical protein
MIYNSGSITKSTAIIFLLKTMATIMLEYDSNSSTQNTTVLG